MGDRDFIPNTARSVLLRLSSIQMVIVSRQFLMNRSNKFSDPTPPSDTPPAGQEPRHP